MKRLDDILESPFAVFCHDAGAANLIIEWLKDCNLEMKVCMEGPAKEIWKRNFPNKNLYPLDTVMDGVTALLSGTGWGSYEVNARNKAKNINIKNIAVIDHWVNYKERFVKDGQEELPDMIIVSDKYAYKKAKLLFSKVQITQLPNNYLNVQVSLSNNVRKKNCRTPIENILIIGEPLKEKINGQDKNTEFIAISYLMNNLDKINLSKERIKFTLRTHPSEKKNKYDSVKKKYINQFTEFSISNTNNLYEDIASADVVVGMNSFALVVALSAAVPTICILPPEANNCVLPQKEIMHLKKM